MIHESAIGDLTKFAPYYVPRMLMLGATGSAVARYPKGRDFFAQWVGKEYDDLDLDGGDLTFDLNNDLGIAEEYGCVFNLGTIEHCWNVSTAYASALRAVRVGGYFLNSSPFRGFESHGIHLTNPDAINALVRKNGFTVEAEWFSKWQSGKTVYWLAAKKHESRWPLELPMQVYDAGNKKSIQ